MKKNDIYFVLFTINIACNGFIVCATQLEKDRARQHIVALKEHIQKKEKEYNITMQQALSETEKKRLTVQYTQNRHNLFKQVRQQRDIINDNSMEKWLWDTAKIVGPIAVAGLIAYKIFAASPAEIQPPLIEPKISIPEASTAIVKHDAQPALPLTKEEIQKYRSASKAYGVTAAWFAVNALFDPFFYPYAAATLLGSMYYGVKGLDLTFKPISLEQIKIVPEELPY